MEAEMVMRENIAYQSIPAAGIHGVGLSSLPGNMVQLMRGFFASRKILAEFKPDVLFFTGGYVAFPMALAGIPYQSVLYVPDIEPGLALKSIARFADHIALTTSTSASYFAKKDTTVTGYPTRAELSRWNRSDARQFLGLITDKPVLLVFGGSKGARSINHAIASHLETILEMAEVIHITGSLDWNTVQQSKETLRADLQAEYHIMPYLHEMGAAFAAADLAVSRSGASALGEYPLFGLPSILVPYPYAWRYQKVNADYLAERGAAVIIENNDLDAQLVGQIAAIFASKEKLTNMQQAAHALATPTAAENIANLLVKVVESKNSGRAHG